jgi:hypothetical protein
LLSASSFHLALELFGAVLLHCAVDRFIAWGLRNSNRKGSSSPRPRNFIERAGRCRDASLYLSAGRSRQ